MYCRRVMRLRSGIVNADARVKIGLALLFGPLLWRAGPVGVGVFLVCLVWLCLLLGAGVPYGRGVVRANILFVLLWTVLKILFDLWEGVPVGPELFLNASLLGGRLLALILLGLALAGATSARDMGLALAWALRPVLRGRAWKAALALALMVHSLPLAMRSALEIRRTMRLRCLKLGFWRSARLYPAALLRALSVRTWSQTMAVACRNLDDPRAWEARFATDVRSLAAGALVAASGVGLAWL